MKLSTVPALVFAAALAGCGVIYNTSSVSRMAGDDGVQIVDLSPGTVQHANQSPYTPRSLPSAFSAIAAASGTSLPSPRLPDPVFEPENRPGFIESRPPPPVSPGPYRIGTGDVLILATPRGESTAEELAGLVAAQNQRQGYTVQDDGAISIPDVGRVMVGGLTLEGAEDAVFQRLLDARIDPSFSLEIAEFNSQLVSVGGAVGAPGVVPITINGLFLDQLIAAAGGLAVTGDDFAIIRIYREGSLYQIPVNELFSDGGLQRIRMLGGDSVFVDTAYDLDRAQSFFEEQIRRAEFSRQARRDALDALSTEIVLRRGMLDEQRQNFRDRLEFGAEDREYVYIAGEVESPGRVALPFENRLSLADALFDSGGLAAETSDPTQIYVLRAEQSQTYLRSVIAYRLDTRNAANYVLATQMELRPGDVIFVAEQPITRWNRTISQILPTINIGSQFND